MRGRPASGGGGRRCTAVLLAAAALVLACVLVAADVASSGSPPSLSRQRRVLAAASGADGAAVLALEQQGEAGHAAVRLAGARLEVDEEGSEDEAGAEEGEGDAAEAEEEEGEGDAAEEEVADDEADEEEAEDEEGGGPPKQLTVRRDGCIPKWRESLRRLGSSPLLLEPPGDGSGVAPAKRCRQLDPTDVPLHLVEHIATLRSAKGRGAEAITIVTQLSLTRLPVLERMCNNWDGPVSAVVYTALVEGQLLAKDVAAAQLEDASVGGALQAVRDFHARMDRTGRCQLDLEFVVDDRCNEVMASFYPYNSLRNRALMLSEPAESLLLLDVDFVVGGMQQMGSYGESWILSKLRKGNAVVLPALGTCYDFTVEEGLKVGLSAISEGKEAVRRGFNESLFGFQMDYYARGHRGDNHSHWLEATEPYYIRYEEGFEPYIIIHRDFVPWYDERYNSRWWDKVLQLEHLASLGTRFVGHPSLFTIHMPHAKSNVEALTDAAGGSLPTGQQPLYLEYTALYRRALKEIKRGEYAPYTSFPHLCS